MYPSPLFQETHAVLVEELTGPSVEFLNFPRSVVTLRAVKSRQMTLDTF